MSVSYLSGQAMELMRTGLTAQEAVKQLVPRTYRANPRIARPFHEDIDVFRASGETLPYWSDAFPHQKGVELTDCPNAAMAVIADAVFFHTLLRELTADAAEFIRNNDYAEHFGRRCAVTTVIAVDIVVRSSLAPGGSHDCEWWLRHFDRLPILESGNVAVARFNLGHGVSDGTDDKLFEVWAHASAAVLHMLSTLPQFQAARDKSLASAGGFATV